MNIQEATKLATERGIAIKRKSYEGSAAILPTNVGNYQCLVIAGKYSTDDKIAHAGWQPGTDDLIADDWELHY
ncbi:TPA: MW1434 family type I TA system toxin [Staphylococcus aureus]|uniref:DUF2829 domain-containing protein n=1 Tax=Staphylococcus aureus TaxID=1280 RepID=A0A517JRJ6_STAAU|nr:MW1434 family type I TA system toxin [Staphylococcus aureus]MBU9772307.1 DUF2829 domain-containing protein [Staphylococcus aureus]MBU9795468.1 DUF2829 domain-containing protein [Staphylococcus aureus]NDP74690.1 DUF2829 domain-containing protein [Staphylococcus aureus]NFY02180.1 DUF2829 domain-containing protein [Staphylococcus aureus]PGG85044.1 hypothetical protein CRU85_13105 [Staphylococcus aureus]